MQSPSYLQPFPVFPNPYVDVPAFDPSRPRASAADIPFLNDLHRVAHHPTLDYERQPTASPAQQPPYRYDRSSSASASSGGALYDPNFGATQSSVYATSSSAFQPVDPAPSPPSGQPSDNGDSSVSNRFTSQSPVASPVIQNAEPPPRLNMNYQPSTSAPNQEHFPHNPRHPPVQSPSDRFPSLSTMLSSEGLRDRYRLDRYQFPSQAERRMSEPMAMISPSGHYTTSATYPTASYTLHRPSNSGDSFSDLYSGSDWSKKDSIDDRRTEKSLDGSGGAGLPSPQDTSYSQAVGFTGSGVGGGGYALYDTAEDEPGSRPSTSGSPSYSYSSDPFPGLIDQTSKTYSFVSLPGNTVRKRPRRRYDEIERLYACNYQGCTKAYGTLNHLNAHVNMQKHGSKRHPNEFKELRKQWRKVKKEQEQDRDAARGGPSPAQHRRRRATEPNLFLPTSASLAEYSAAEAYHDAQQQQQHLQSLSSMDLPYGHESGGAGGYEGQGQLSSIGYGHHHYATPSAYHHLPQRSHTSPSPIPRLVSGHAHASLTAAAYAHSQHSQHSQALDAPSSAPSPPPINRLPPDSTLLTPLHPTPASFHPSLPLPRIHESPPPLVHSGAHQQHQRISSGPTTGYETYSQSRG